MKTALSGELQLPLLDSDSVTFNTLSGEVIAATQLADATPVSNPHVSDAAQMDIEFSILRLDLATRWAMGNKYFKLTKNLDQLLLDGVQRVLSYGGAWSNHLLALAQTAQAAGIQSVGVVRGEEGFDNPMLDRMRSHGMHLHFISRSQYKLRHQTEFCSYLCQQLNCDSWMPEGGANELAVTGCELIADLINKQADITRVISAVGTGATLAGIIRGCTADQTVNGIQVVNDASVVQGIKRWIGDGASAQWSLSRGVANSSYAKPSQSLLEFIVRFHKATGIALDPVYTGPALQSALSADFLATIASGERVVFVHTGGLAGVTGFNRQFDQCSDQAAVTNYRTRVQNLTR